MQILQVQVEAGEMSGELLLRHTEPPELGGHGIHPVCRAQSDHRAAVLGQHRGDHDHFRGFHNYGKAHVSNAILYVRARVYFAKRSGALSRDSSFKTNAARFYAKKSADCALMRRARFNGIRRIRGENVSPHLLATIGSCELHFPSHLPPPSLVAISIERSRRNCSRFLPRKKGETRKKARYSARTIFTGSSLFSGMRAKTSEKLCS